MRAYVTGILLGLTPVVLLAPAHAATPAADTTRVLVTGSVDLSPTCPVQRPGEDCTDRGVEATITARRPGHTRTTTSGPDGFRMRLAPGVWRITADAGMSCPTVRVDLRSGKRPAPILIACDTGIR